ncbi:hypothetical protein AgCh_003055 [Apium graveolens]
MSIVPKEKVEVIAQSIGINNLTPDAALALAPDVEYRMREIMQEAIKCMHHSRRTTLTTDDIDSALKLRNVEVVITKQRDAPVLTFVFISKVASLPPKETKRWYQVCVAKSEAMECHYHY